MKALINSMHKENSAKSDTFVENCRGFLDKGKLSKGRENLKFIEFFLSQTKKKETTKKKNRTNL